VIGLNKGTTHAEIHGSSPNPFVPQQKTGAIIFVILFLLTMVIIALVFFYRANKLEKERTVTFAPTESKKRYKNGVEIKASENINESRDELLDQEDDN
jgi:bacteriorhodopsin